MTKLVVVIGVTGNQGGSVALRFLKDSTYQVRGLTRDPTSSKAQALAAQGIDVVQADLEDVSSLESAFKGASIIFSVTNYWEPFFAGRAEAAKEGISCRKYAYDVEYRHGKNITDAASTTVDSLAENGFLVSTLSHGRKCSGGKFTELYHFDSKADIFPDYVAEKYPKLAAKMSCIQTGFFMTSYRLAPGAYFSKQPDGSFQTRFTTDPDVAVPHLDVNGDTGSFVYAVAQRPPGGHYMAEGSTCSWSEFFNVWSKITGQKGQYKQVTTEELVSSAPDKDFGIEIADMFTYCSDPGYDGGMELLKAEDLRKAGIDCPMTTLEEFMKKQDWSIVLNQ